jgi:hypothetical protein
MPQNEIGRMKEYFINYLKYKIASHFPQLFEPSMSADFMKVYRLCQPYTMTNLYRMYALNQAIEYVCKADISGDFVECGVWRGGSAMNMAYTLQQLGQTHRKIYLYDTFQGMVEPSDRDTVSWFRRKAIFRWQRSQKSAQNLWCYASLSDVRSNLLATGYPKENLIFVQGKVEETLSQTLPDKIALLRLDTDWYRSTLHELTHLFPRLTALGVLIVDDYGHWEGQKQAVDEYFRHNDISMLLTRIDYGARIGIKPKDHKA